MSYRPEVIYPVGTEVMTGCGVNSCQYGPLDGRTAVIGRVVKAPCTAYRDNIYYLQAPPSAGHMHNHDKTIWHRYASSNLVLTPDDYVRYRENVRVDINLRRALVGKSPDDRMDEDYVQWVRDAYTRSGLEISQTWMAAGGIST